VASYPRLKPGTYEFRVTAANKDGVRSVAGAGLRLIVVPMIWETLWFRLLLAAALGLVVVFVVRGIFTRRIRRRLRLLEQQNVLQQERARIAKDMHDDIGARLTQIGILTEVFARGKSPQTAEIPSRINSLTRDVVQALDEIVWAVNPRNDSLEPLVRYLLNYAEEYLTGCAIRCRTNTPGRFPDRPVASDTRHNLYLAVKEALNNIVKHSGATEVRIEVTWSDNELELSLHDNGRGIQPEPTQRRHGEGLENLRRRLESLGGRTEIANAPEGGCRVRFILPLPPA
jgi:signal transduction histidine kinase